MRTWTKFLTVAVVFAATSAARAQQGPPGGGGFPGGPDGGPPDSKQMRAMMEKHIQQNLSVSDADWAKLQPLVDKVEEAEQQADLHHMGHGGPPRPGDGGGPDDDDDRPKTAVEKAIEDLKSVLTDDSATDEKIAAATKAVEDAEKKAADELADSRKTLKAVLNARQTAILVAMGVLN